MTTTLLPPPSVNTVPVSRQEFLDLYRQASPTERARFWQDLHHRGFVRGQWTDLPPSRARTYDKAEVSLCPIGALCSDVLPDRISPADHGPQLDLAMDRVARQRLGSNEADDGDLEIIVEWDNQILGEDQLVAWLWEAGYGE